MYFLLFRNSQLGNLQINYSMLNEPVQNSGSLLHSLTGQSNIVAKAEPVH